jgi:hypothetical protein
LDFLASREAHWGEASPAEDLRPADFGSDHLPPAARGAAWVEWCLALLNANEFLYVD